MSEGTYEVEDKDMLKTLIVLAFGSLLLTGCGADQDESAAETDTPSPVETPDYSPEDETSPADTADTMPADEPDPAMSDTLPKADEPPPVVPSPPSTG
jgi:hypothetical protein